MSDQTSLRIAGWVFAVAFFMGLILVGDQAGAFADSESAYTEIFSDSAHRTQDIAGSILLIASAIAFGTFAYLLALGSDTGAAPVVVRVAGGLAAASMLVAGAAFFTVPASLALGDFYGDPGIVTAQNILPSLGYTLLVDGAAIPAATVMFASTRLALYPRWLAWVTVVAAVLLVVTGGSVITMVLLSIWVAVVAFVVPRQAA